MAHVYAARAVLPSMIERGGGYFLQMASAAGVLNQIGDLIQACVRFVSASIFPIRFR